MNSPALQSALNTVAAVQASEGTVASTETLTEVSFEDRCLALPDRKMKRGRSQPYFKVNTNGFGVRGIVWKGEGKTHRQPTVGIKKLNLDGTVNGNRRCPIFWVRIDELAIEGITEHIG